MSVHRNSQVKCLRTFQGGDVTVTSSPQTMTSFSSRSRPTAEPITSSGEQVMSLDGSLTSSPYANRSQRGVTSQQGRSRSKSVEEDLIELPPEMQETIASRYQQQPGRKSSVIRIDARSSADRSDGGSLKRKVPSPRGPISPQPPGLATSHDPGGAARVSSAGVSRSGSRHPIVASPPPTSFSFNQSHLQVSATPSPPPYQNSQHTRRSDAIVAQDATLPYQQKPLRNHSSSALHESRSARPGQTQNTGGDVWEPKYNKNTGQRVTFAQDKKSYQKANGKDTSPVNGKQLSPSEHPKVAASDVNPHPKKKRGIFQRRKTLCLIICLLILLLLAAIILLAHFATRNTMSLTVGDSADATLNKVSRSPPSQTSVQVFPSSPKFTQIPRNPLPGPGTSEDGFCLSRDCVQTAGAMLSRMDKTINPCSDFYKYSCGGWLANNYLKVHYDQYGVSHQIAEKNDRILYELLRKPALDKATQLQQNVTDAEEKAKIFYKSCIDVDTIEFLSGRPILEKLGDLGGWDAVGTWNRKSWNLDEQLYQYHGALSVSVLFGINVDIDPFNTSNYILLVGQDGILTFPDRSFYTSQGSTPSMWEKSFVKWATKLVGLLGASNIPRIVNEVYSFEYELAQIQVPIQQIRAQQYRKITIADLGKLCPQIDWFWIFQRISVSVPLTPNTELMIQGTESYFRDLSRLLETTDRRVVHNYLVWRFVFSWSSRLSVPFRNVAPELRYDIYGTTKDTMQRSEECLWFVKQQFATAVGIMFVRATFPPEAKIKVEEITRYVKQAFSRNLETLPWANRTIRAQMTTQLNNMAFKIGFDERLYKYPALVERQYDFQVSEDSFFNNYLESVKSRILKTVAKLGQSVVRNEWTLPFYSTGAFYMRQTNEMIIPAGLLQPPMFDLRSPMVLNFGSIGSTIAHEILHGFETWVFEAPGDITDCVLRKYSSYEVKSQNLKLDGGMTLRENIADMGGLKIVYKAYRIWVTEHRKELRAQSPLPVSGMDADQLFFVSFAQSWCMKRTGASERFQLTRSNHSPENFRVIGSVSQFRRFAEAFRCAPGTPMRPVEQCNVW